MKCSWIINRYMHAFNETFKIDKLSIALYWVCTDISLQSTYNSVAYQTDIRCEILKETKPNNFDVHSIRIEVTAFMLMNPSGTSHYETLFRFKNGRPYETDLGHILIFRQRTTNIEIISLLEILSEKAPRIDDSAKESIRVKCNYIQYA